MNVDRGDRYLVPFLADVLGRVVTAREALGDGDTAYAAELMRDLEEDLACWTAWHEEQAA